MPVHDLSGAATARPGADGARQRAVARIVSTGGSSAHLDRLTRLAAELLEAPSAQVSLLGEDQVVWSAFGDTRTRTGPEARSRLEESLCTVTADLGAPLVVPDAAADPRVQGLLPVTSGQVGAYLGVPLLSSGGQLLGALCVFDPSPRAWSERCVPVLVELASSVVAELELRVLTLEAAEAAARLELALDAADIGSFDLEVETGRLVWDERLMRLFGYDPSTFVQHLDSFNARLHPDDLPRVTEAVEHAVATSGDFSSEYRVVRPDGSIRWVEARGRVVGAPGAERLLGVAYDSTELREARDRLSRLLESMSDAFFSLDPQWRFTYVNREAERLLGRRRDELLGRSLWDAFPEAVGTLFEEQYRGAVARDEPVTFEGPYAPLGGGWYEVSAWPGPDGLSVYFREISARRRAESERERAYADREQAVVEREQAYATAEAATERLRVVADASTRLAATLQPAEVLQTLGELVVPSLGQWLAVALTSDTSAALTGQEVGGSASTLTLVHVVHAHAEQEQELRAALALVPLSTTDEVGVGVVVRTGRSRWLPEVPDEVLGGLTKDPAVLAALRRVASGSALTLPLVNRGRAIGAVMVGQPAGDALDRGLLGSVASRAAVALDNALLYAAQQGTAATLQRSLLPRRLPRVPGVDAAARYLPGATGAFVGGDWYQGVQVGERLVLAMGDVMGHGMRSAARMGQLRAIVATLALEGHGPQVLLERLAGSCDVLLDLDLATLLVASLDPRTGRLTVSSAGHPPPLVVPARRPPSYVDVEPGPPLGTVAGAYPEVCVQLEPGGALVLYTDGLVEQRGETLDAGLDRLRDAVAQRVLPPDELAEHVLDTMGRSTGGSDDVALLVLTWAGEQQ